MEHGPTENAPKCYHDSQDVICRHTKDPCQRKKMEAHYHGAPVGPKVGAMEPPSENPDKSKSENLQPQHE